MWFVHREHVRVPLRKRCGGFGIGGCAQGEPVRRLSASSVSRHWMHVRRNIDVRSELFFLKIFKVFASTPSSPGSCCTGADLFRKDFMFPAYYLLFYLFVGSENGDFASVSQSPSICCRRLSTWAAINPAGNFLLRKQCQRRNAKVPALVCILGERTLQPPEAPLTNQLPTALPS